ncbi:ribonuclease H-like domain-containing protein [Gorgonomyces haynaldii]|nr:ribonuclease H-like domain-containing protein [Gorgonomyces haynaldii]
MELSEKDFDPVDAEKIAAAIQEAKQLPPEVMEFLPLSKNPLQGLLDICKASKQKYTIQKWSKSLFEFLLKSHDRSHVRNQLMDMVVKEGGSVWCILLKSFDIQLSKDIPWPETELILEDLKTAKKFHMYCSMILDHNLLTSFNIDDIYQLLLEKGDLSAVDLMLAVTGIEPLKRVVYSQTYSVLDGRVTAPVKAIAKNGVKVFTKHGIQVAEPQLLIASRLDTLYWLSRQFKDISKDTDGNPAFDHREIMQAYLASIFLFLDAQPTEPYDCQKWLANAFVDTIIRFNALHPYTSQIIQRYRLNHRISSWIPNSNNTVSNKVWYSSDAEITFIDDMSFLEHFHQQSHVAESCGLDCEWGSMQATLSTVQIALQSKKTTTAYVFDAKTLTGLQLQQYLTPLWESQCNFLVFSGGQDFTKISAHSGLGLPQQRFDLSDLCPTYLTAGTKKGLTDLAFACLGAALDKRPRMGCWDMRPLPRTLIRYAAWDACVLLALHRFHLSRV